MVAPLTADYQIALPADARGFSDLIMARVDLGPGGDGSPAAKAGKIR